MMRIGEVGVLPIAYFGVQDAELQPCRSEMRIERDGAPQRRQSRLASAGTTQSHTKLEVRGGVLWLGRGQPGQYGERFVKGTQRSLRQRKQQECRRLARHHLEYLFGLFRSQTRFGGEQPAKVREGNF
jgi:hypothetical protein